MKALGTAIHIVDLDGLDGEEGLERIRKASDPERSVHVVAASRDPALAVPAMLAGAVDFALLPRDSAWLEEVGEVEAQRRSRAVAACAPEGHERLVVDVPADGPRVP